jgi:4-hydroxybenzoate polyprenyltransferase
MIRRVTAWLQLLRLPNVFTAVADVMMGYLVTRHELRPAFHFALLVVTSCCLYLSGMVLNDVFDADIDAREQPDRPIPSGRISLAAAKVVGWGLLVTGVVVAWCLGIFLAQYWTPGVIATLLAACILMYDGPLKHTRIGPLVMGECRFLNVLLGMSLPLIPWEKTFEIFIAAGIGVYVFGVTVFARTDAHTSSRSRLLAGFVILIGGMGMLAAVPMVTGHRPPLEVPTSGWYMLWIALALITARRCLLAILEPSPLRVQSAVRFCVQSLIVLNAAVCVGYAGPYWGFAVLALLIPTLLLTMWLNAT